MSLEDDYWDGVTPLRAGLIVKYNGSKESAYYKLPDPGTLLTVLAEDVQMERTPVWICRWYDDIGRVNLIPLIENVLGKAKQNVDPRVQQVADNYYQSTGLTLEVEILKESLDFLLSPGETIPVINETEDFRFTEIKFHTSGGHVTLENVRFPVTMRLSRDEYKLYPELNGITIIGSILNMIPGADKDLKFSENNFYLFYLNEEVTYKEQ